MGGRDAQRLSRAWGAVQRHVEADREAAVFVQRNSGRSCGCVTRGHLFVMRSYEIIR